MMKDFKYWDNLHRNENLEEFNTDRTGLLWLKLKSIIRVNLIKAFFDFSALQISTTKQSEHFKTLFDLLSQNLNKSHLLLDKYIKQES